MGRASRRKWEQRRARALEAAQPRNVQPAPEKDGDAFAHRVRQDFEAAFGHRAPVAPEEPR